MINEYNIGDIIGIWVIDKIKYGPSGKPQSFKCHCKECSFPIILRTVDLREDLVTKNCTHLNVIGNYKNMGDSKWNNERVRHIFQGMIRRCYNSNSRDYRWYGAKGIKICEEWLNHPEIFEEWALKNGYKDGLTIDRIDEKKDYCPENCRWITNISNAKYKSTTKILEVDGEKHTGREWAEVLDLGTNIINTMLRQYNKEVVKDFIRLRQEDTERKVHRKSHQTWLNAYGIDPEIIS